MSINNLHKAVQEIVQGIEDGDVRFIEQVRDKLSPILEDADPSRFQFPYGVSKQAEDKFAHNIIQQVQMGYAVEWAKDEPRLAYEREWSAGETFSQFQDYMVNAVSDRIVSEFYNRIFAPVMKAHVEEQLLKGMRFEDMRSMHQKAKKIAEDEEG